MVRRTTSLRLAIGSLVSTIVLGLVGAGAWLVRSARAARRTKESWQLTRKP